MPYDLVDSAMAESTDQNGVLLFGGFRTTSPFQGFDDDKILELKPGANHWEILDVTLPEKRSRHTVIPLS